ncbi:hypothetical protein GCM10027060_11080 [Nesterenkonia halophila]|uniref:Asp23/Gls24 family envelope stress response protein n=1 Tax=Nesterenkonia halophila TaxID=302044 RepID=UPI0014794B18|nr:Asp23/Gls24 family envelope stress response protein [Nesterenkonia halophila]
MSARRDVQEKTRTDADEPDELRCGRLTIREPVVRRSAAQAASELPEVWATTGVFHRRAAQNARPDVAVRLIGGTVELDVTLAQFYRSPLRAITESARSHLKRRVEALTGLPVRAVNFSIEHLEVSSGVRGRSTRSSGRETA